MKTFVIEERQKRLPVAIFLNGRGLKWMKMNRPLAQQHFYLWSGWYRERSQIYHFNKNLINHIFRLIRDRDLLSITKSGSGGKTRINGAHLYDFIRAYVSR